MNTISEQVEDVRSHMTEILQECGIERTWVWRCPHCDMRNILTWDDGRAYMAQCISCNETTKVYRSNFRFKKVSNRT